jgi:2-succinyl-6-hydroxy-2,4-cyclohexadiene-1-carboxylate synthase
VTALPTCVFGTGEPLVLLHGFTGRGDAFGPLAAHLPGRALVAPDLPGHGRAPPLAAQGRAAFGQVLDVLAGTLDAQGLRQVDLHGYSMGARLALAFALRHPARVRRLVLESGSPGLRTRRQRLHRRAADERLAHLVQTLGVGPFVARWEALPLFAGLRALPEGAQSGLRARREGQSPEGLAWALRSLGTGVQPSQWERLARLPVPVLVISGGRDAKFTRIGRELAARIPEARAVVIPGAFHVPHLEAPGEWAREISRFLS